MKPGSSGVDLEFSSYNVFRRNSYTDERWKVYCKAALRKHLRQLPIPAKYIEWNAFATENDIPMNLQTKRRNKMIKMMTLIMLMHQPSSAMLASGKKESNFIKDN